MLSLQMPSEDGRLSNRTEWSSPAHSSMILPRFHLGGVESFPLAQSIRNFYEGWKTMDKRSVNNLLQKYGRYPELNATSIQLELAATSFNLRSHISGSNTTLIAPTRRWLGEGRVKRRGIGEIRVMDGNWHIPRSG